MAGICGFAGAPAAPDVMRERLLRMARALMHRGPHGQAVTVDPTHGVALHYGHLALRGTAEAPTQPLANESGRLHLVCDGRIFNAAELAADLRRRGHRLATADGAEILLHLYEEQGRGFLTQVEGMFGFALWDDERRELILGRDRLGVKALYYAELAGRLLFASEIKGLLAHPDLSAEPDPPGVYHFLTYHNVPAPGTLFRGIRKIPPGSFVAWRQEAGAQLVQYWDTLYPPRVDDDETYYVERLRATHTEAVRVRIEPGAPTGALLSGGNDSSANVMRLAHEGVRPLHTISVGYSETEGQAAFTDLEYAHRVARLADSEHHELLIDYKGFLEGLSQVAGLMDDLISEPSIVFLFWAIRTAGDAGVRVLFVGEGNDELMCGHGHMMTIRANYYRHWVPYMRLPGFVRRAAALAAPLVTRAGLRPGRLDLLRRAAAGGPYLLNFEVGFVDAEKAWLLTPEALRSMAATDSREVARAHSERFRAARSGADYLDEIIYLMMHDYWPNLMGAKMELLTAAHGIEARSPYLDHRYVEAALQVPPALKMRNGTVKYAFRRAIEGLLPGEIIYRPKQGFRTPLPELFRGSFMEWALPRILKGGLARRGWLRLPYVQQIAGAHQSGRHDFSSRLWILLVLSLWYERWIEKVK